MREEEIISLMMPAKRKPRPDPNIRHESERCRGCPYGKKQYCVGVCWKNLYSGYKGNMQAAGV